MKRRRQILFSSGVILLAVLLYGWTGGYYWSPETCVEDSLRGLYFTLAEKIDEVRIGSQIYYLYANDDQYAVHGVRNTALFFYVTTGGSTHNDYGQSGEAFEINGLSSAQTQVFVIRRNQPDIEKIEIDLGNGVPVIVLDQWHDDFAMAARIIEDEADSLWKGTCRAWDKNGKLIEERRFPLS